MSSNTTQQLRSDILKEQAKLVNVEKELQKMLEKVNQDLNILKVEELQLKSNALQKHIQMKQSRIEEPITPLLPTTSTYFPESPTEINNQDIDLELIIKKFEEEDNSD